MYYFNNLKTRRLRTLSVYLLLTVFLSSCAAPQNAPDYKTAKAIDEPTNQATLYIFREYAQPTAWKPTIYVDDHEVAALPQESFTWVYIEEGKHKVTSKWPFLAGPDKVEFIYDFEPSKKYYFEITGTVYSSPENEAVIKELETATAIKKLEACCRFIEPKK